MTAEKKKYVQVPMSVFREVLNKELTAFELAVWMYVRSFQWKDQQTGKMNWCKKSASSMADEMNCSVDHFRRCIRKLHKMGYMTILYRGKMTGTEQYFETKNPQLIDRMHKSGNLFKVHSFFKAHGKRKE